MQKEETIPQRVNPLKAWVEAMRLRTLPVSVAGVFIGASYAAVGGRIDWLPTAICLIFAVLAQIAANFANEYFDWRDGLDKPGREGFRRGVTEGDIKPGAMLGATIATLVVACAVGCTLILWSGWWLIAVGFAVAVGVVAYSAGPVPLSRVGLGEIAVVVFFGLVPVNLTAYFSVGDFSWMTLVGSVGCGLLGSNILIVNNYRDCEDDRQVGKRTLAVRFGLKPMATLYLVNGYLAMVLMAPLWVEGPDWSWAVCASFLGLHSCLYAQLITRKGAALNPILGGTAMLMLAVSVAIFAMSLIGR